ncbi:hypothetical protein GOB36_11600 [Sinorhizobium meliloti]|uniref:hypothetical protein n=1 Tax=Rhizobium meliloti TaxID=382 RepID=UPI00299DD23A|nr:hypothetical protein [Sinorhizobium meliloti]MDX0032282.1 hypothetical protein [Sinorhizobium meliloti]
MHWDDMISGLVASLSEEPRKFVVAFARFEFGLKMQDDHPFLQKRSGVFTDWDSVSQAFGEDFFKVVRTDPVASYLIDWPPMGLVKVRGGVTFRYEKTDISTVRQLFGALVEARNNFFHGMKPSLDRGDVDVLRAANATLRLAYEWAKNHKDIKMQMIAHRMAYA